jgi:hypothetical protein
VEGISMKRNPELMSSDIMRIRQHFQLIEAGSKEQIRDAGRSSSRKRRTWREPISQYR